jgi:c-di-GMP-related signal transduction protein
MLSVLPLTAPKDAFVGQILLTHQPIITKQGKLIANRLILHVPPGVGDPMTKVTSDLQHIEEFWPMGQQTPVFLSFEGAALNPTFFDWLLPENATLEMPAAQLVLPDGAALVEAIRSNNPSTCLAFDMQAAAALQAGLSFRFIGLDAGKLTPQQMQAVALKVKPLAPIAIALNVGTMASFTAAMEAGLAGAAGWFCKTIPTGQAKELAPAQAHVIRVINLVRNNADVAQIEAALKQDVALSYRLLRYINSAGFGLSCEVQSFRHAVTILGYDKLNKWLSLLLVSSSKDPMAPAMMHTALVRARFMELLGEGLVNKAELDNLFITGAFSLLDLMLGVTLDKVLEPMNLPEEISEALLSRRGQYAPFFDMALAAEEGDAQKLGELAGSLGLDHNQVNAALLQSLSFAADLST